MNFGGENNQRFRVEDTIGTGNRTVVYRVLDTTLQVRRAAKVGLDPSPTTQRPRLMREALVIAQLSHPNIVTIHDIFEEENKLYTLMELAEMSLSDEVERNGFFAPGDALDRILPVLDAIGFVHENQVLHRDIKPQNILVFGGGVLKLADFDIAKNAQIEGLNTRTGTLMGTASFMPPEQTHDAHHLEPNADLYAFAGTLLWCITGFTAMDFQRGALEHDNCLPKAFLQFIEQALNPDPEVRFQSAHEMKAALLELSPSLGRGANFVQDGPQAVSNQLGTLTPQRRGTATGRPSFLSRPSLWVWVAAFAGISLGAVFFGMNGLTWETEVTPLCTQEAHVVYPPKWRLGGRESLEAAAFDVNQDGLVDAIFSNQQDETLSFYFNSANGFPQTPITQSSVRTKSAPAFGDLNDDGLIDMVVTSADQSLIEIRLGTHDELLPPHKTLFQGQQCINPLLLDWDGDGSLDLVITGLWGLLWRKGDGKGSFAPHQTITSKVLYSIVLKGDGQSKGRLLILRKNRLETIVHSRQTEGHLVLNSQELPPEIAGKNSEFRTPYKMKLIGTDGKTALPQLWIWGRYGERDQFSLDWEAENPSFCRQIVLNDHIPAIIADISDFNNDGAHDFLATRTCAGCTSNHVFIFGEESQ